MKGDETRTKLVPVTPSASNLIHRLLAVSTASEETTEDVVGVNVGGFVCVTEIDAEKGRMTVLSPQPGPLPKTYLLVSDIQFMDSQ